MDQLETQVSDLRSFLLSPASPMGVSPLASSSVHDASFSPAAPHHPSTHHSPLSAPGVNSAPHPSYSPGSQYNDNADGATGKRKSVDEEGGGKQQRSKRNRYISIACNECKRRKIKCNGQNPCQRCGHLHLQCLYAPNCCSNSFRESDEFKQMQEQVSRLTQQVDTLFTNMAAFRQERETLRLAPIQHDNRALPPPPPTATVTPSPSTPSIPSLNKALGVRPSFSGPTSIAFTVDVAKNTLHNMGYSGLVDSSDQDGGVHAGSSNTTSPMVEDPTARWSPATRQRGLAADPLWEFTRDDMIRLCRLHEEEVGIMYPVIKIDSVIDHARNLAAWMDVSKRNGCMANPPFGQGQGQQDDGGGGISTDLRTLMLKIVMCCALSVEEHGNSAKAIRLYDSMQPIVDKKLMSEPADVANLPFLALVGGYRFLSNEEILAWRVMGQVARLCLELGLHRREGLDNIQDPQDRRNALNTFWSAYVLDRRWSFGTGLPYVLHDDKIDPKLPYPEDYPYLVAMITYSKLGAKIWKLVDYFEPAIIRELKHHDFEDLDRQILDWYETVPDEVKVNSLDRGQIPMPSGPAYDLQRLQIWTRLRLNQIRIWLYTPVLHSAISTVENMPLAEKAVDLAKETIRYLAHLNHTTDLYSRIQVFYHQFLTSAIAVLFLASTHAPLQFSANCRGEFYMALDLVKDMSARSWVSQRLWRTIRSLKAYAPRLGLLADDDSQNTQSRSIAAHANAYLHAGGGSAHHGGGGGGGGGHGHGHGHGGGSNHNSPGPGAASSYGGGQGQMMSRNSPMNNNNNNNNDNNAATTPTTAQVQQQIAEDQHNGLRLQTEMSRIFEGYMGMNGVPGQLTNEGMPTTSRPPGLGGLAGLVDPMNHMDDGQTQGGGGGYGVQGGESVYEHFRDMF